MQSSNLASLDAERCSNLHCYTSCSGCGQRSADYDWSSSNPAVATVTIDGVVQTKGLGRTVIRATALGDVLNDDEVCNYSVFPNYPSFVYCVLNLLLAGGCAVLTCRIVVACCKDPKCCNETSKCCLAVLLARTCSFSTTCVVLTFLSEYFMIGTSHWHCSPEIRCFQIVTGH